MSFDLYNFLHQFLYDKHNPLLFNNGFFVYFFLLFIILFYYLRNKQRSRTYVFCFFSLYFFYKASGAFVLLVILSAIVDFKLSHAIYRARSQKKKRALLLFSLMFNLGLLFYFKYTNFFIDLINNGLGTNYAMLNLLLPVGISFYTFENISYTIDIYRGEFKPTKRFSEYLLFLSFFPKLVMGPIVRAKDFIPQIGQRYIVLESEFAKGFYLIITGLIKKLIISDYITLNFVDYVFDDPSLHNGLENLMAVYGYAFVIYCDFSGYSDIAIGIALWLGFKIPANFRSPYKSRNVTEFWRRWHISLSTWLKDYLYIPLGGNRNASKGTWIIGSLFFLTISAIVIRIFDSAVFSAFAICVTLLALLLTPQLITSRASFTAANFNLLATMLLGGFWHGASLNFILWGALHGIALPAHKLWMMILGVYVEPLRSSVVYKCITLILTFNFVCFCWIFFKAKDFATAMRVVDQIMHHFDRSSWKLFVMNYWSVLSMIGIAVMSHFVPEQLINKTLERFNNAPIVLYVIIFFVFLMAYSVFRSAEQVMPIYLQF